MMKPPDQAVNTLRFSSLQLENIFCDSMQCIRLLPIVLDENWKFPSRSYFPVFLFCTATYRGRSGSTGPDIACEILLFVSESSKFFS